MSLISGIEKCFASEGYVTFFCRKVFVSHFRNISQRDPSVLCFRKFLVGNWFMDKREGEASRFSFDFFSISVPTKFVGEPFRVSLISGIEKFYAKKGYVTIFVEFFFSQYRNTLQGNPSVLCFGKFPVAIRFFGWAGWSTKNFLRKNLVSQCRKVCRWTL